MTELEFPWKLDIETVHFQKNDNIGIYIEFKQDGKMLSGIDYLLRVKDSKIKILKLIIEQKRPIIEQYIGINFMARKTGPIPYIENLTHTRKLFYNSTFTHIPKNLFKYNPQLASVEYCFDNCINLKTIPNELFTYNKNIVDYYRTFADCISLEYIPYQLFPQNINDTQQFGYCFSNCAKLKEVPSELLKHVDNYNLSYAFAHCTGLETIPRDIFSNNIELNGIYFNKIFDDCPKLKNIPKEILFKII